MRAILSSAQLMLAGLNRASCWRREMRVWDQLLCLPTADRLLYAALHHAGWMGRAERRLFPSVVRPGMTVLDVGANVGLYALFFSGLVGATGAVYAFEPEPALFEALNRGRALANQENLHTYSLALGDQPGKHHLHRSFFNSGDNRVLRSTPPGETGDSEVMVARGDDLLTEVLAVDFIKIDVQGWELHVLRGLSATIARSPGIQIFLEFWPEGLRAAGSDPLDLIGFVEGHGLTLRRERGGRWERVSSSAALQREMSPSEYINLWAAAENTL